MPDQLSPALRQRILTVIRGVPGAGHLGVVLAVDGQTEVLRRSQGAPLHNQYVLVDLSTGQPESTIRQVAGEALMAGINCTAAVIAGVVTFGSAAAVPITGGTSGLLTYAGQAATVATSLSCVNSLARTYSYLYDPQLNQRLDSYPAYKPTLQVLDGVSLIGVGASAVAATRAIRLLGKSGIKIPAALGGRVNRQRGAQLAREIAKAKRPGVSNKEIKGLMQQGSIPKRYPAPAIKSSALNSLRDSFAASMSFLSSAFDGNLKDFSIYVVNLQP